MNTIYTSNEIESEKYHFNFFTKQKKTKIIKMLNKNIILHKLHITFNLIKCHVAKSFIFLNTQETTNYKSTML